MKTEKYLTKFITPKIQGGGGSAGIWGCISHKDTGCASVYTGRVNQYTYQNILENEHLLSVELFYHENSPWIFQQDGATAHTAHSVRDWLSSQQITVIPWCARSPDLNPDLKENIWSYMDSKLVKCKLTSVEGLKEQLQKIWLEIPRELCMNLIESMPKRVRACYRAKGGHFKYLLAKRAKLLIHFFVNLCMRVYSFLLFSEV